MDVFDDNSNDDDFREISGANFRKMQEKITKLGYADGVAEGEEKGRQIGFDAGFADGLLTGFEIGKFECLFKKLKDLPNENNEKLQALSTESIIYENMNIADAESTAHCAYLSQKDETEAASLSQHQQTYIKHMKELFGEKLPLSSEFLKKSNDNADCNTIKQNA